MITALRQSFHLPGKKNTIVSRVMMFSMFCVLLAFQQSFNREGHPGCTCSDMVLSNVVRFSSSCTFPLAWGFTPKLPTYTSRALGLVSPGSRESPIQILGALKLC